MCLVEGWGHEARHARVRQLLRERQARNAAHSYPLSATQQGIWLADTLNPGISGYHDVAQVELQGHLDTGRLRRALAAVMRRHEALRARIETDDDVPMQIFDRQIPAIETVDLCGRAADRQERHVDRLVGIAATEPFALDVGPLWRGLLIRLDERRHLLVLVVHHLIGDGESHNLVWRDLLRGYADPLLPAVTGYGDWLRTRVAQEDAAVARAQKVADRAAQSPRRLDLPGCGADDGDRRAHVVPVPVAADDWEAFLARASGGGVTLFSALLGLFGVELAERTGAPVTLAVPLSQRWRQSEGADLAGCMVDLLPTIVEGGSDDIAVGQTAWTQALEGFDVPYREIARLLSSRTGRTDDPVTNVAVEQFNVDMSPRDVAGLRVIPRPRSHLRVRHDLTLTVFHDRTPPQLLVPRSRWDLAMLDEFAMSIADRITRTR
ncbi:condensation domain-containing protein [Nocardioides zeae]|uniref:Condensation domain-containing protein n=1 Tax=Nocardioides zeae TaxID=1457234 RepID=A0AAJ1U467_9ACTN|nr:condensation domain-containing protein [Nocardioides zeae]MDQ1102852.1 hypothetical protein [Nocardioides zeae]